MRKALVFIAAFALVLVAGAAVAFMTTPSGDDAVHANEIEKTTTTSAVASKEEPRVEPLKTESETPHEEKAEESPPEEEGKAPAEEAKDTTPPYLVILHPEDGQHFTEKKLAFEGRTEPGARVYAGEYEADVDEEGNFRIVLILTHDGANKATLKAIDPAGNESTASVTAYYDASEEKTDQEVKDYEFTIHQKYGSCAESPPYDKWYGTGKPGTKVWIESRYGSAATIIGDHGEWYVKVTFPESPCNETFQVVAETNTGFRKLFEFTRICEESGGHGDK